jgi:hypothetical protein
MCVKSDGMNQTRLACLLILLVACSKDDDSSGENSSAAQACEDMADVVGKAAERCGSAYQANHDAFIDGATGGKGCSAVVRVRDEASLRGTCFPSLSSISCDALKNATADSLDASCKSQLLRPSSASPTRTMSTTFEAVGSAD